MTEHDSPPPTARMRVRVYTVEVEGSAIDVSTALGTLLAHVLEPADDAEQAGWTDETPSNDVV
jgi:hypothetical protein